MQGVVNDLKIWTREVPELGKLRPFSGGSFSGNERNPFFLNAGAPRFLNLSVLSGLDTAQDGRSFAAFDYDRDGLSDVALTSRNAPRLTIYRNGLDAREAAYLAVRLVGGNRRDQPSSEWSNRDGIGARVEVRFAGRTLVRERRAGQGLASQGSSTLLVGLDGARKASLWVRWPSGKEQAVGEFEAGRLVTVYEDPGAGPRGQAFAVEPYRAAGKGRPAAAPAPPGATVALAPPGAAPDSLRLYTTMATWCPSCRAHLPEVKSLLERAGERLQVYGVPVDPNDTPEKLEAYRQAAKPAYSLWATIPAEALRQLRREIRGALKAEPLPSSVLTDARGRVLAVTPGLPTLSALRAFLRGGDPAARRAQR